MKRWKEDVTFVPELRVEAQSWCVKHGIDPHSVMITGLLREGQNGYVEVETIIFDENGVAKMDFDAPDQPMPITRWVPVQGSMPSGHLIEDVE